MTSAADTEPFARDDRAIVDELLAEIGRVPPAWPPGEGGGGPEGEPDRRPLVSSAVLGMLMFLGAETMFFAGLVGAFLVLRLGAQVWPPPLQPRLPVEVTGINTLVLLASGLTMALALRAIRRDDRAGLGRHLGSTAVLGAAFLAVQGYEWARLVQFGLTVSSGVYGATFYTLVGVHGVHVLGALAWVVALWAAARGGRFTARAHLPVALCRMFWSFVVLLWPVLYVLVYLR